MEHYEVTVGIAEDHTLMRSALNELLTICKYKVIIVASDGQELITKIDAATEKPAICFIDANMPVMDGCETVAKLKGKHPQIKLIAYSEDTIKARKMLAVGAHAYLPKRSSMEVMTKCIDQLLK